MNRATQALFRPRHAALVTALALTVVGSSAHAVYNDRWLRCPMPDLSAIDRDPEDPPRTQTPEEQDKKRLHKVSETMYALDSSFAGDMTSAIRRPWLGFGVRTRGLQSPRNADSSMLGGPTYTVAFLPWVSLRWPRLRNVEVGVDWGVAKNFLRPMSPDQDESWDLGNPGLHLRIDRTGTTSTLDTPFYRWLASGTVTWYPGRDTDTSGDAIAARIPFESARFSRGDTVSLRLDARFEALGCHEPFFQFSAAYIGGSEHTFQLAAAVGGRPSVSMNVVAFIEYAIRFDISGDEGGAFHAFNLGGRWRSKKDRRGDVGFWLTIPAGRLDGFAVTVDLSYMLRSDRVFRSKESGQ